MPVVMRPGWGGFLGRQSQLLSPNSVSADDAADAATVEEQNRARVTDLAIEAKRLDLHA